MQETFDWTWAERREWITEADFPKGRAYDGSSVSAAAMVAVLNAINDHLGKNPVAWPSQAKIAEKTKLSEKTIQRASEALQSLSLLIVEPKKGRSGTNHYRIVWTELQLLQPARRAAWEAILREKQTRTLTRGSARNQSDIPAEQSDIVGEQSDILTDQSDTMSDEYHKGKPQKKTTTTPEPDQRAEPQTDVRTWEVVVSELIELGLSETGARQAAAAARNRGLTPDQAHELGETYRTRTRPGYAGKAPTVGWLYRWLTGQSTPEPDPAERPKPVTSGRGDALTRDQIDAERRRREIIRQARSRGLSEEQIRKACQSIGVAY
ncbi:helix-turn-helix domain-containing protein [Aureliella helgolandensis]|uniref:Helix-turn-helix domain-containing protein n=1 Tax=Aureliella helgolandensis TaxID=2527968 RepID=A0A518GDP2_9BACT|nr:helix-turn-helix domain-containing protein [Aureliella helgolandensis]QDV26724.1 hypothetical protein Q31a_51030 [Aureliella helgolandensis]